MHPKNNASQPAEDLVLVDLPSGEAAWLRPEHHTVRVIENGHWPPEMRVGITDRGRDYLAIERARANCFGPWPTVAEACGLSKRDQVA